MVFNITNSHKTLRHNSNATIGYEKITGKFPGNPFIVFIIQALSICNDMFSAQIGYSIYFIYPVIIS